MKLNRDRMLGSVIGLAVGDALGQAVEFKERGSFPPVTGYRGGGAFGLNPGEWTDDTSMALAFMDAVLKDDIEGGRWNCAIVMDCWVDWYKHGKYSVNGRCFDIGCRTRKALQYWIDHRQLLDSDESALGNGALMRLAPAAIMDAHFALSTGKDYFLPIVSGMQGVLTHNSVMSNRVCCQHATQLFGHYVGMSRKDFSVTWDTPAPDLNGGRVDDCRELATWAFLNSTSFGECVLKAVNLGGDADSVGAVAGQIAGACYGLEAIRSGGFLDGLAEVSMLLETTEEFIREVEAKFKMPAGK